MIPSYGRMLCATLCGVLVVCSQSVAYAQGGAHAGVIAADLALSDAVFANGPNTVLAAALGADGVLVWPGAAVVQGGVAATKFFARQGFFAPVHISWQPFRVEFSADSTLALLVGVATMDRPAGPPLPAIHRIGRYLAAWKQVGGRWQLAALAFVNLIAPTETMWNDALGLREMPSLRPAGLVGRFVAADSTFAADAGVAGASKAFAKWAAADAMTFAVSGEYNLGPAKIGALFAANTAHWAWGAVAAGASADGTLGWTVGQATITAGGNATPVLSKYLTFWRKMPDGTIKFTADGGNARP